MYKPPPHQPVPHPLRLYEKHAFQHNRCYFKRYSKKCLIFGKKSGILVITSWQNGETGQQESAFALIRVIKRSAFHGTQPVMPPNSDRDSRFCADQLEKANSSTCAYQLDRLLPFSHIPFDEETAP